MDLTYGKATAQHLKQGRLRDRWQLLSFVVVFLVGVVLGNLRQQLMADVHVPLSSARVNQPSNQQPAALNHTIYDADLSALSRLNEQIQQGILDASACEPTEFGKGWGNHHLCQKLVPTKPCHFYSFGGCRSDRQPVRITFQLTEGQQGTLGMQDCTQPFTLYPQPACPLPHAPRQTSMQNFRQRHCDVCSGGRSMIHLQPAASFPHHRCCQPFASHPFPPHPAANLLPFVLLLCRCTNGLLL